MNARERTAAGRHARLAAHFFTLAALAAWAGYAALVEPYQMPGPWLVVERLWVFLTDWYEAQHALYSIAHILIAVAISFVVGTFLAFLPFYLPSTRLMVHGRISPFLNSFSGIGWALLALIWFGVNDITVIFAISMVLIPFSIINMREGLDNLDRELLEMSNSFTRSRWRQFYKIVVPSLYPFIFATVRISFGVAWKVALTAELLGGNTGMGYLLNLAWQNFDRPLILVVIVVIVAFVYSTDRWIFAPIQARLGQHHAA